MNFDHIFNWRLLDGSHDFPGPDGGTCINEAAIVAAGFEYKKINSAEDCPPCFSRPFAAYALYLNDKMPADLRQRLLMPFVMRLAGTADTPKIERQRAEFIILGILRDVVSIPLVGWKDDLAAKFKAVLSFEDGIVACNDLALTLALTLTLARARARARALGRDLALDLAHALDFAHALDLTLTLALTLALARARDRARDRARALGRDLALDLATQIFEVAVDILDGAMKIGRQPELIDTALIELRMETMKKRASERVLEAQL